MTKHDELIAALEACELYEGGDQWQSTLPMQAAAAIRDLLDENEALRSGAVCAAVKPLVWEPSIIGKPWHSAQSPWGFYYVQWDDEIGAWFAYLEMGEVEAPIILQPSDVKSIEDAKDSAQADYESRVISDLTIRPEAEVRNEGFALGWTAAIEAAASRCSTTENVVGGILSRLDDALAPEHGELSMHARGQTPDWFIEAASESCYLAEAIRAITPPADIFAALEAKLDEAFQSGVEAMREAALDEVHQECWADGNGSSVAEILLVEQATTTLAMDAIRSLPTPERKKGCAE